MTFAFDQQHRSKSPTGAALHQHALPGTQRDGFSGHFALPLYFGLDQARYASNPGSEHDFTHEMTQVCTRRGAIRQTRLTKLVAHDPRSDETGHGDVPAAEVHHAGSLASGIVDAGEQPARTVTSTWARDKLPRVAHRRGPDEHQAEEAEAGRVTLRAAARGALESSPLASDEGTVLPSTPTGLTPSGVRVHQQSEDRRFVELLGARAATHGRDIFLGPGEDATDTALIRHELAHVCEGGEVVRLRSATWLERRAWLGFFDHYLPRKFLNNYMDDSGAPITLTAKEMEDCNAVGVDIRRSQTFITTVATLAAGGGGTAAVKVSQLAGALTNGTLGNFTVKYDGTVTVKPDKTWVFNGTMTYYDYWDFDPKGSGSNRPWLAELKVRVAAAALPGQPFNIYSVAVPVTQTDKDSKAMWGSGAAPVHIPDNLKRGGADIVVGDVSGGVAGPAGDFAGAEAGGQANADLGK